MPKWLEDLSEKLSNSLPKNIKGLGDDAKKNIKSILESAFSNMKLVTREEFDAQKAVLERTREQVTLLEAKISELEQLLKK